MNEQNKLQQQISDHKIQRFNIAYESHRLKFWANVRLGLTVLFMVAVATFVLLEINTKHNVQIEQHRIFIALAGMASFVIAMFSHSESKKQVKETGDDIFQNHQHYDQGIIDKYFEVVGSDFSMNSFSYQNRTLWKPYISKSVMKIMLKRYSNQYFDAFRETQ